MRRLSRPCVFTPAALRCWTQLQATRTLAGMGAERPDSSAGGAGGRADAAPSTKAQSGGLAQRLLSSARRQQEALVGTISSLLRGCSSRSHKPSREPKLSAAASARSEPSRDSTHSETGAVATLVAFGHGGQSHEVHLALPPARARARTSLPTPRSPPLGRARTISSPSAPTTAARTSSACSSCSWLGVRARANPNPNPNPNQLTS